MLHLILMRKNPSLSPISSLCNNNESCRPLAHRGHLRPTVEPTSNPDSESFPSDPVLEENCSLSVVGLKGDLLNWIQEWGPIVTTHDIIAYLMQELYPEGMYPMGSASQHQLLPADVSEPNNQGVPYETATVAPPGPLIGSLQQGESSRSNELQGNDQGDDMIIDFHNGEGHTQYVNQSHPINEQPSSKFNLGRR